MAKQSDELEGLWHSPNPRSLILISLARSNGLRHGFIRQQAPPCLVGPGTLYGALTRLESRGLIQRLESDERRNPYRLTSR